MGLFAAFRSQARPRPSPQRDPAPALLEELRELTRGARAFAVEPRRAMTTYLDTRRPSVAPRIEEITNPDDRALRRSLVLRGHIARQAREGR